MRILEEKGVVIRFVIGRRYGLLFEFEIKTDGDTMFFFSMFLKFGDSLL